MGILLGAGLLSGCSLKKSPAALQINTNPLANIFLDGKLMGKTPYNGQNLKEGEYSVKLIPESTDEPLVSWEAKVKLHGGVLTLIERDFGSSEAASSGQILTLEKAKDKDKAALTVVSNPDGALVHVDGEAKGFTPINIDEIGIGDHQVTLAKDGFSDKTVKARAIAGFKLIVSAQLSQEGEPSATDSATPSPDPTASDSPGDSETVAKGEVKIKDTPTGWLRVRSGPGTSKEEIARVNPGETYRLLDEENGWYQIELKDGEEGWIAGQYATKI